MRRASHFHSGAVTYQLHFGEFNHLSSKDRKKLRRIMARISEKSYRRGVQHGYSMAEEGEEPTISLDDFRYRRSLDQSPAPDGYVSTSALDRLDIECRELHLVGLGPKAMEVL